MSHELEIPCKPLFHSLSLWSTYKLRVSFRTSSVGSADQVYVSGKLAAGDKTYSGSVSLKIVIRGLQEDFTAQQLYSDSVSFKTSSVGYADQVYVLEKLTASDKTYSASLSIKMMIRGLQVGFAAQQLYSNSVSFETSSVGSADQVYVPEKLTAIV